ncbi:hypothetical protein Scep_027863 [Stephania cephalantha]|uniref:Uncharacterized protein n=1 Tax=Stephania cephalantha TaxID=152367 RepID=A0AAP0E8V7_9MAGN
MAMPYEIDCTPSSNPRRSHFFFKFQLVRSFGRFERALQSFSLHSFRLYSFLLDSLRRFDFKSSTGCGSM